MAWSWLSSSVKEVSIISISQKRQQLYLQEWIFAYGFGIGLRVQLCRSYLSNVGCRIFDWTGGRCRYSKQRPPRETLRWTDPYLDLWWSTCPLWPHCLPYFDFMIIKTYKLIHSVYIDQSVSFSPMHFTLCKLNQLSDYAILPKLIINLSDFWVTLLILVRMWHWVLGTAKTQFLPS